MKGLVNFCSPVKDELPRDFIWQGDNLDLFKNVVDWLFMSFIYFLTAFVRLMPSARSEEFASCGGSCSFANITSSRTLLIGQAQAITLILLIYFHFVFLRLPIHKGEHK